MDLNFKGDEHTGKQFNHTTICFTKHNDGKRQNLCDSFSQELIEELLRPYASWATYYISPHTVCGIATSINPKSCTWGGSSGKLASHFDRLGVVQHPKEIVFEIERKSEEINHRRDDEKEVYEFQSQNRPKKYNDINDSNKLSENPMEAGNTLPLTTQQASEITMGFIRTTTIQDFQSYKSGDLKPAEYSQISRAFLLDQKMNKLNEQIVQQMLTEESRRAYKFPFSSFLPCQKQILEILHEPFKLGSEIAHHICVHFFCDVERDGIYSGNHGKSTLSNALDIWQELPEYPGNVFQTFSGERFYHTVRPTTNTFIYEVPRSKSKPHLLPYYILEELASGSFRDIKYEGKVFTPVQNRYNAQVAVMMNCYPSLADDSLSLGKFKIWDYKVKTRLFEAITPEELLKKQKIMTMTGNDWNGNGNNNLREKFEMEIKSKDNLIERLQLELKMLREAHKNESDQLKAEIGVLKEKTLHKPERSSSPLAIKKSPLREYQEEEQ
jgi:hypothetical protein